MTRQERDLILEVIDSKYITIDFNSVPEILLAHSLTNQKLTKLKISIKSICNILINEEE
jgi:hypothetical protein